MKKFIAVIVLSVLAPLGLNGESLWLSKANNEAGIFSDRTALNVGDILTIMVDETTTVTSALSKSTNTSSNFGGTGIERFFYSGLGTIKGGQYPDVTGNDSSTTSGGGSITSSRTASTTASVLVIDRLPNGNLVVEGAREISVSGETQYVIVRGIVRRDDIMNDNTVMSSKIANAQVEFLDKGAIASTQKQGWISRLLDVANIW